MEGAEQEENDSYESQWPGSIKLTPHIPQKLVDQVKYHGRASHHCQ